MTPSVALRLGRVSNLPTIWTNVLAAAVWLGASPVRPATLALMLAMSLFYVAGMYWNDAFDAAHDRDHRPSRPIPAGLASVATVFGLGAAMAAAGLAILLWLGLRSGGTGPAGPLGGAALIGAILVYDVWHKGNPAGPILMALCRVLVYVTVAATLTGGLSRGVEAIAAVAFCYLVGLTYAAKQEDLKQPGRLWPLIFLAAPFAWGVPVLAGLPAGAAIYVALLAAVVYALSHMVRPGRANIPRVVSVLLAGICLLDALFIGAAGRPMLAGVAALGFVLTLLLQRSIPGT